MGVLGRLEFGESTPARGWCPKKGGCTTEWVEALAVEGEGLGRSRGGLTSKIHLAVDGRGLPTSILVTPGQAGDNPELLALLDQVNVHPIGSGSPRSKPRRVIADKAYSHPSTRRALRARASRSPVPSAPIRSPAAKPEAPPVDDRLPSIP